MDSTVGGAARTVGLAKVYGKGEAQVRALDGVDVTFGSGRFTAVMGPSGSGKSTLMPVSYTHLDVYKRQACPWPLRANCGCASSVATCRIRR